jgi:YidC/Oxa1 family membrane protein insertase
VSILNPLFDAVAWVMMRIVSILSPLFGATSGLTWGLSIVLLVVLMRLIMVPLFIKQRNSMLKMQSHMPQLAELRKKFKNDKQRLQEETMKFYKENGINPLGGCLPLLAQMPVFWALFNVLRAIAEWKPGQTPAYGLTTDMVQHASQAHIFGATLADSFLRPVSGETWGPRIIILVFVLVSAATTFLTMKQSQRRGMMNATTPDPDQPGAAAAQAMSKNMMYIAPFFALSGLYWQFGLVIYWVTTNVWTLGQQHFLFRNLPVVGSATVSSSADQAKPGSSGAAARNTAARTTTARNTSVRDTASKSGATKSTAPKGTAFRGVTSEGSAAAKTRTERPVRDTAAAGASAKVGANGSANGAGGFKLFGKKAEPVDDVPAPQTKTVRQQPSRQTRSKRNTGKG